MEQFFFIFYVIYVTKNIKLTTKKIIYIPYIEYFYYGKIEFESQIVISNKYYIVYIFFIIYI